MFGWLARLLSPHVSRPGERDERRCPLADGSEREWCEYLIRTEPIQRLGDPHLEVVLADKSRCDILTTQIAWEVDFARKWREGIKQAVHYGALTGRRGGLILLYNPNRDGMYFRLTKMVLSRYQANIRPELVLCNTLNGGLHGAIFEVVDATIVAPKPSGNAGYYLGGCLLLLIGVCCLGGLFVLLGDSRERPSASRQVDRRTSTATVPTAVREPARSPQIDTTGPPVETDPIAVELPVVPGPQQSSQPLDQSDDELVVPTIPSGQEPKSVSGTTPEGLGGMRKWTDASGKYSVEAEFLNFQNSDVQLRKRDGKVIAVPMSKLAQADVDRLMTDLRKRNRDRCGLVTAVGDHRAELCEIRFVIEVQSWEGKWLALYRGETFLGLIRVVATRGQCLVADTGDVRTRIGDVGVCLPDSTVGMH